ncbi:hypothetical protein [Streptomyces sp. NBC_01353]|uniref:hypothetical protein n=1 Tax=Streptomyces sp. NBC_01353 TaxID=2903835 RepID=UPI002E366FE9|nr:hypothetical protein [Streptomyces sp. NBC_01353]
MTNISHAHDRIPTQPILWLLLLIAAGLAAVDANVEQAAQALGLVVGVAQLFQAATSKPR